MKIISFLRLFKMCRRGIFGLAKAIRTYSVQTEATRAKQLQEVALKENCILVDMNDRPVGMASKKDCHRVSLDGHVKLHRAFSVFLFNSNGDMLIQRRSKHKVQTFFILYVFIYKLYISYRLPFRTPTPMLAVPTHCMILKVNEMN